MSGRVTPMGFDGAMPVAASPSADQRTALLMLAAVVLVAIVVYLLPTLVAAGRGVPNLGSIVAVNLLMGWTLAGWVVALALALRDRPASAPQRSVAPSAGWYPDPELPSRLRYWSGTGWSDAVPQPFVRR